MMKIRYALLSFLLPLVVFMGCIDREGYRYEVNFYENEAWAYNNSHNNLTTIIQFVDVVDYNGTECYVFETHRAKDLTAATITNTTLLKKTYYKVDDDALSLVREEFYKDGAVEYSYDYYPYLPLLQIPPTEGESWEWSGTRTEYIGSTQVGTVKNESANITIDDEKVTFIAYVEGGMFYCYVINVHASWQDSYDKYYWAKKSVFLCKI